MADKPEVWKETELKLQIGALKKEITAVKKVTTDLSKRVKQLEAMDFLVSLARWTGNFETRTPR